MSQRSPERRCEVSHRISAATPIVAQPPDEAGPASAQARSRRRCQQRPSPHAASEIVVNDVVVKRSPFWNAVPDRDRTRKSVLEDHSSDRFPDQLSDAAARPPRELTQSVKFFLRKVNLDLFHVCQSKGDTDIRQRSKHGEAKLAMPAWRSGYAANVAEKQNPGAGPLAKRRDGS